MSENNEKRTHDDASIHAPKSTVQAPEWLAHAAKMAPNVMPATDATRTPSPRHLFGGEAPRPRTTTPDAWKAPGGPSTGSSAMSGMGGDSIWQDNASQRGSPLPRYDSPSAPTQGRSLSFSVGQETLQVLQMLAESTAAQSGGRVTADEVLAAQMATLSQMSAQVSTHQHMRRNTIAPTSFVFQSGPSGSMRLPKGLPEDNVPTLMSPTPLVQPATLSSMGGASTMDGPDAPSWRMQRPRSKSLAGTSFSAALPPPGFGTGKLWTGDVQETGRRASIISNITEESQDADAVRERQRRFSMASNFGVGGDSKKVAEDYFAGNLNRRGSMDSTGSGGLSQLASQMAAANLNGNQLPVDFQQQYGKLFDSVQAPVMPSPPVPSQTMMNVTPVSAPVASGMGGVHPSPEQPLYMIEFKGGRKEFFYVPKTNMNANVKYQVGDLVIVEADRGEDLGKIVVADIVQASQLRQAQGLTLTESGEAREEEDDMLELMEKGIQAKKIHRLAEPQEINMLLDKARDEAKALAICQAKSRQKNLPIEVVDAEYQWDRRRLTFYFISENRVDFRALVKDLFKLYKTRIWMSAISHNTK